MASGQGDGAAGPRRQWDLHLVERELHKLRLTKDERARLGVLMERYADGRSMPSDVKRLDDFHPGLFELRLRGERRIFRLYFADEGGVSVVLALHLVKKKRDRDLAGMGLARERLKRWRE